MSKPVKTYNEDDAVCIDCIEDGALRELVREQGDVQACVECGNRNIAISIKDLAVLIDPYIRGHYKPGPYERRFGDGEDDSYWEEQQGEDLSDVVQELVGQYFDFHDELVDILIENDPADIRDGGEPFYASDINYVLRRVYVGHLHEEWHEISRELRTERRFFSDRARRFYEWLFTGIEDLWFYEQKEEQDFRRLSNRTRLGVIQEWPAGT